MNGNSNKAATTATRISFLRMVVAFLLAPRIELKVELPASRKEGIGQNGIQTQMVHFHPPFSDAARV
jgi:hypothetical protein